MFRKSNSDRKYFEMFAEISTKANKSAILLEELFEDTSNLDDKVRVIEAIEHESDEIVHDILFQVHKAFITPIDREDIHLVAKELDNVVDSIEDVVHKLQMYSITSVRKEAVEMAKLITKATVSLTELLLTMYEIKKIKSMQAHIIEINRLENECDVIYCNAIKRLFDEEKDSIEIIKWKSIFEKLEKAIDYCENIANIIEGIVMKHA